MVVHVSVEEPPLSMEVGEAVGVHVVDGVGGVVVLSALHVAVFVCEPDVTVTVEFFVHELAYVLVP